MSTHESIRLELPAYASGRLDEPTRERVEQHLLTCESCRELASTFIGLAAAIREGGGALLDPHPTPARIQQLAAGVAGAASAGIERHLEVCASCALEAGFWKDRARAASAPIAPRVLPASRAGWYAGLAGAAGLVLGLGIGLLLRLPGASLQPPGPERPEPPAVSGPASPTKPAPAPPVLGAQLMLPPARRSEPLPALYRLEPGQTAIVVSCPASVPRESAPAASFVYRILTEQGDVAWSHQTTAEAIRRHREQTEVVTLLVPGEAVPPGLYRFQLAAADGPEPLLYEAQVRILPPGPHPR